VNNVFYISELKIAFRKARGIECIIPKRQNEEAPSLPRLHFGRFSVASRKKNSQGLRPPTRLNQVTTLSTRCFMTLYKSILSEIIIAITTVIALVTP
jgi:hypothetical protein